LGNGDAILSVPAGGLILIDQQFDLWFALWRVSPIAIICRQQAAMMAQMIEKAPVNRPRRRKA
jgi:hypothetical protein